MLTYSKNSSFLLLHEHTTNMDDTEIATKILESFAEEKNINIPTTGDFYDKAQAVEESIEERDDLEFGTEVEIEITATLTAGLTTDTLTWDGWVDGVNEDLTMQIADDGFERAAEIESVQLKEILDW